MIGGFVRVSRAIDLKRGLSRCCDQKLVLARITQFSTPSSSAKISEIAGDARASVIGDLITPTTNSFSGTLNIRSYLCSEDSKALK